MNLFYCEKGETFEGIALVKSAEVRVAGNGSRFLDLTLVDATGEMNGKVWNWVDAPAPEAGTPVHVRGVITEFGGKPQMRVDKLQPAREDEIHWEELVPTAPEPADDMYLELQRTAHALEDRDLSALALRLLEATREKLLYWPAAVTYHHAERTGLLHHTVSLVRAARALLPLYPFLNADLLLCGVILHDLCKIDELAARDYGLADGYSTEGMLIGHIVLGVEQIGRVARELQISEEKTLLLRHMILAHHSEPEFGSPRRPMIPEGEMLHHLDNLDARLYEMRHALAAVKPGEFSPSVRSLENRKLYRPKA